MKKATSIIMKCICFLITGFVILLILGMYFLEGGGCIFGCGWLSIHIAIFSYHNSFYELKKIKDKQPISGIRLLYDLSPKVWISVFRYFFCFAFGVLGAIFFIPELSGAEYEMHLFINLFIVLFAIGLCAYIIIFVNLYKLSKKEHILDRYKCKKKSVYYDSDNNASYTVSFDGLEESAKQNVYEHAEEGNEYYVVLNSKQNVLEIYDTQKWIPSLASTALSTAFKNVLVKICTETLLYSLITFLLPIIVNLLSPIVEQFF